jgi:hypothetical protein
MKFGEYNFGLLRNAKHGMMAGEIGWNGEVGKAYRMGIAYFMVPALLSAVTKNDWFRVIQHDSANRIDSWWTFFTGDEKEFKTKTYGRGAIGALVGAPVVSDALALGELAELWELDPDGWAALLAGYNDMSSASQDQKTRKLFNILNVQVGRALYNTGDLVFDGHGGRGLFFEMGLFPTARAKKYQDTMVSASKNVLPDGVFEALDRFAKHRKSARSTKSTEYTGIKR